MLKSSSNEQRLSLSTQGKGLSPVLLLHSLATALAAATSAEQGLHPPETSDASRGWMCYMEKGRVLPWERGGGAVPQPREATSQGNSPALPLPLLPWQNIRVARAGLPLPADTWSSLSAFPVLDSKILVRSEKQL